MIFLSHSPEYKVINTSFLVNHDKWVVNFPIVGKLPDKPKIGKTRICNLLIAMVLYLINLTKTVFYPIM